MVKLICADCGTSGLTPKTKTRGSFLIEVLLWLCFGFGIFYTLWRLTTRYKVCRRCGGSRMIPLDSPLGRKIAEQQ